MDINKMFSKENVFKEIGAINKLLYGVNPYERNETNKILSEEQQAEEIAQLKPEIEYNDWAENQN